MARGQVFFLGGPVHGQTKTMDIPIRRTSVPYIRYENRIFMAEPEHNREYVKPYLVAEYEVALGGPITVAGGGAYWILRCVRADD